MPQAKSRSPRKPSARRVLLFTTATIVSFSLTLLVGSVAVLSGLVPLQPFSTGARSEIGAMLFMLPVIALVLAVVVEATGIALTRPHLPEPRRHQEVRWSPGRRDD